jgi:hypothetical protein
VQFLRLLLPRLSSRGGRRGLGHFDDRLVMLLHAAVLQTMGQCRSWRHRKSPPQAGIRWLRPVILADPQDEESRQLWLTEGAQLAEKAQDELWHADFCQPGAASSTPEFLAVVEILKRFTSASLLNWPRCPLPAQLRGRYEGMNRYEEALALSSDCRRVALGCLPANRPRPRRPDSPARRRKEALVRPGQDSNVETCKTLADLYRQYSRWPGVEPRYT